MVGRRVVQKKIVIAGSIAFMAGLVVGVSSSETPRWISDLLTGSAALSESPEPIRSSNLYAIRVTEIPLPSNALGGAIAALRDGVLLAGRGGELWHVTKSGVSGELGLRVPMNTQEFNADPDLPRNYPLGLERLKTKFGVKGMLVRDEPRGVELYVAHHHWDVEGNCLTLRVSKTGPMHALLSGEDLQSPADWETLFETSPCLPVMDEDLYIWAEEAGGRIESFGDWLLLSVGDHGFARFNGGVSLAQELDNSYGKTILIDARGEGRTYTFGHRNPQGLAVASDGSIYLTEHGPSGGDELNLLIKGKNYGWPLVTYGRVCLDLACTQTSKDDLSIVPNRHLSEHEGYEKPIYSWVPSIGISNLTPVTRDLFEDWKGDLLVGSLAATSLFRLRIRDGRVVYAETLLNTGRGIRDIAEAADGTIVLKMEGAQLLYLEPAETAHSLSLRAPSSQDATRQPAAASSRG